MLILNVDDDSDDREFFKEAIRAVDPQIDCMVFQSGEELLTFLDNSTSIPDYIFIDINMPRMNGYECAQEIRPRQITADTQIIMYSTAFNPRDLTTFGGEQFKHVVKEHSFPALVQSIKTIISVPACSQEGIR